MEKKRNAKGEGSFKINPDGTVTHRKCVGYKANGYRKIITVTRANKAACIKEMKRKEALWKQQEAVENVSGGTTVAELCELHLRYQVEQEELKPKSIDRRECTIEKHIAEYPLGHYQVQNVKTSDIDNHVSDLIKEKRLSPSSIEKVIDVLNAAYHWAVIRGELQFNPVAPIKPTLVKRLQKIREKNVDDADVDVLSEEEEERFKAEALRIDEKTGEYVYSAGLYGVLLLTTGMRCGEMIALRWKDGDLDLGYLKIERSRSMAKNRNGGRGNKYVAVEGTTKNNKARRIKLTTEAWDTLKEIKRLAVGHCDADDLIVVTKSGRPNTATNLEHRMAVIFKNAGLEGLSGGLHIFRRTFATRMYEKGGRTKEIAAYIGDLESTTEKYYIAVRKKVKEGNEIKQVVMPPVAE